MAFGWDDAAGIASAGIGALGDLFGSIGDQGFGAGERLQPEWVALRSALPPTMKFFLNPMQQDIYRGLYESFKNSPIDAAITNLMAGRRFNQAAPQVAQNPWIPSTMPAAPTSLDNQIASMMSGGGNFAPPVQRTNVEQPPTRGGGGGNPYYTGDQSGPFGPSAPRQAQNLSQSYNSPQGQLATKAIQLRQALAAGR